MSMLSSQINELRGWANQLSEREDEFGVVVRALVVALRDAADTIDGLRTRCQDVQAENETLRADAVHRELGNCPSCPNVADLQEAISEREKLRELAKNMYGWLVVNYEKSYVIPLNGLNDIERDMRELGIEVDE